MKKFKVKIQGITYVVSHVENEDEARELALTKHRIKLGELPERRSPKPAEAKDEKPSAPIRFKISGKDQNGAYIYTYNDIEISWSIPRKRWVAMRGVNIVAMSKTVKGIKTELA